MSKNKLIAIIAAALAVIIAVSVIFIVKNKNIEEEETTAEITTEVTTVEEITFVEAETSASSVTEETETTEKEKLTKAETTVKKAAFAPDKDKDTYEVLYKKEHIIGIQVKLWGTYLKEIKGSDSIVHFSAKYDSTSSGEDEKGSYTDYLTEGHSYYFDLKTKKGYREDWSVVRSEYDATGDTRLLGDGFPEKQNEYDAVEIRYEKDCVVLTFWLDKPLKYKNVDAEFEIIVEENIFGTEFGIGNFEFRDMWFGYAEEE